MNFELSHERLLSMMKISNASIKWTCVVLLLLTIGYFTDSTKWKLVPQNKKDDMNNASHGGLQVTSDCTPLSFMPNESRPVIALASFPGSGNTWLRHLIQQSTGFLTGSIYCNDFLKNNGFPGECRKDQSVIVTKTHKSNMKLNKKVFKKAVLLIRKPFDAFFAEIQRKFTSNQTGILSDTELLNENVTEFVSILGPWWKKLNIGWLNFPYPVHVVFYEDMQKNLRKELERLIPFLEVDKKPELIDCAIINSEGMVHRRKRKPPTGFLDGYITSWQHMEEDVLLEYKQRVSRIGRLKPKKSNETISDQHSIIPAA